jgi:hypothetical protein
MAPSTADTDSLNELLNSTLALVAQCNASLNPSPTAPDAAPVANPPNALIVLRDSAKLLKAHTTKISLLAINTPFTPSAVRKVLTELSGTCVPAMMSAVQICEQQKATWGTFMGREAQLRVRGVCKEMAALLQEVQSVAQGNVPRRRDRLHSTGVVWESCDALMELEKLGIAGLAVQKAEQYRDTIKDAIEELREWKEGEDLDSEGRDGLLDSDDEGVEGDRDSIEDIFSAANSMPKDRPELAKRVEEADGKLKKIVLLFAALIKRRLKTYKGGVPGQAQASDPNMGRLDGAMESLRRLPHQVDELAGHFYDLDEEKVKEQMSKCVQEAIAAAEHVRLNWNGEEDEFTAWSLKWKKVLGESPPLEG